MRLTTRPHHLSHPRRAVDTSLRCTADRVRQGVVEEVLTAGNRIGQDIASVNWDDTKKELSFAQTVL